MKVVFVAINGIGLGHLNRTREIARALRERAPAVEILFVTNSIKPDFVERDGFAVVRPFLPYDPTRDLRDAWLKAGNAALEAILVAQQPDVVVYDYLYWRSLLSRVRKKVAAKQVLVLRHRVGKSAKRLVKRELRKPLVDVLLVPHRKDDFDTTAMSAAFVERLAFVGEIAAPPAASAEVAAIRARHGLAAAERLIVVSPGGGGADECAAFFSAAVEAAVRVARERGATRVVAISGPLRAPDVAERSRDVLTIVPFEPAMIALTAAADAMVALAGYNTTQEILVNRTPAVLVPKLEGRDDQVARVHRLAVEGLVLEGAPDVDLLTARLRDALGAGADALRSSLAALPRIDGAARAAAAIAALADIARPKRGILVLGPKDAPALAAVHLAEAGVVGATLLHLDPAYVAALAVESAKQGAPQRALRIPFTLLVRTARKRIDGRANQLRRARAVTDLLRALREAAGNALSVEVHDEDGKALARYPMPWLAVLREGRLPPSRSEARVEQRDDGR